MIFRAHACSAARSESCAEVRSRCSVRSGRSSHRTRRSAQSTDSDRPGRVDDLCGGLSDCIGVVAPQPATLALHSGCVGDRCGELAPRRAKLVFPQDAPVILQELSLPSAERFLCTAEGSLRSAEQCLHTQDATFRRDFGRSSLRSGKCAGCLGPCSRRSDSSRRCQQHTRDELMMMAENCQLARVFTSSSGQSR